MIEDTKASAVIDAANLRFTSHVKDQLKALDTFSDDALEWLMLEHYQFSSTNPGFLSTAATTTQRLAPSGVAEELLRNFREEGGHAAIYKQALAEIGSPVETRRAFAPTQAFLAGIEQLTKGTPSQILGTMYATETAAIFEHEVFWDISREVCRRRGIDFGTTTLKRFHDMHLEGVEQSHKDGLGIFIDRPDACGDAGDGEPIDAAQVADGAEAAIRTMRIWWEALLDEARRMTRPAAQPA
ncbi:MAG: iron-containing redox enzyme family protein [Pseudomonadota bacterium]